MVRNVLIGFITELYQNRFDVQTFGLKPREVWWSINIKGRHWCERLWGVYWLNKSLCKRILRFP